MGEEHGLHMRINRRSEPRTNKLGMVSIVCRQEEQVKHPGPVISDRLQMIPALPRLELESIQWSLLEV